MRLTSNLFRGYVDKLYDFIERYSTEPQIKLHNNQLLGFNYGLLPAAVISLNSKMTQLRIADEIEQVITKNDQDIELLRLSSFNFASMSALFQAFFSTLITDDICLQNDGINKRTWKKMSFEEIFQLWLGENSTKSQHKRNTSLVIFVNDFENINKQNLINLILILKEYVQRIPILFVFLIYNELNSSIQYFLPSSATDNLLIEDIEPFYEPKLIPELLVEFIGDASLQFKIHPNLIREISIYFKNYEYSFSNFLFFLKSLMFDHYYNNPLSSVCQSNKNIKKTLQNNERLLNILKNSLPLLEPIRSDQDYIDKLVSKYSDLLVKHEQFTVNLQILIELRTRCCIETSEFLSLYCEMANAKNYNYKEDFLAGLLRVRENMWKFALKKVTTMFNDNLDNDLVKLLLTYQMKLIEIIRKETEDEESQLDAAKKLNLECDIVDKVKILKNKLRNLNSRSEWKQSIALPKNSTVKQLSPFDQWKVDLIDSIDSIMQRFSPSQYGHMIDSLFYNNFDFILNRHFVCVRDDIHHSLSQDSGSKSFKNIYPNSFILYQLFNEASPVINLYEWFEEFCEEKQLSKKNIPKDELIVHFSTTLSDFDYIGLMQSSKYKADYLNKLVWL